MIAAFPHAERAKARATIQHLKQVKGAIEGIASGRTQASSEMAKSLLGFTGASDLAQQHLAVSEMLERFQADYLERLYSIAADDLTAFAEIQSPDEPPARHHIFLCDHLHAVAAGDIPNFGLSMPPGHAKDLDVETPVLMGDGTYKRLGDIQAGDMVVTKMGRPRLVTHVHDQGEREILKVTTASGRTVRPHPDHLFLTPAGWVKAGDLKIGDNLALVRDMAIEPTSGRSYDEFLFVGYMLSLGFARDKATSKLYRVCDQFRSADLDVMRDFKALCTRLGFKFTTVPGRYYGRQVDTIHLPCEAVKWLKAEGVYDLERNKVRTPEWVFRGSRDEIGAFVGALFSSDAALQPSANKQTGRPKAIITLIRNGGLLDDVQRLLQRLGVTSLRGSSIQSCYNYRPTAFYRLTIADESDQVALGRTIRTVGKVSKAWKAFVPPSAPFERDGLYREDKVVSIEPAGTTLTRCLTVHEDSSFLANDLVVHNSTYASVYFPAWWMGKNPTRRYLQAGHTQKWAEKKLSKKVRQVVASPAFQRIFPGIALHDTETALESWRFSNEQGEYTVKGIGQGISGERSHCCGIDDPYKNVKAARSKLVRQETWDWYASDFRTRRLPGAPTLIVATRWHDEDLLGRIETGIRKGTINEPWEIINLPVRCLDEEKDPLQRKLGELLWPEFFTESFLEGMKADLTSKEWSCLYEGISSPEEGELLKSDWLKYYKTVPRNDPSNPDPLQRFPVRRTVLAVDTAKKETARGNYSAIAVVREVFPKLYYVCEVARGRWDYLTLVRKIDALARQWSVDMIRIEPEGMGLQYLNTHSNLAPAPVTEAKHDNKSKEFRFDATLAAYEAGQVLLPEDAPWVAEFLKELLQFPEGSEDDQVDAITHALSYLMTSGKRRLGTARLSGR